MAPRGSLPPFLSERLVRLPGHSSVCIPPTNEESKPQIQHKYHILQDKWNSTSANLVMETSTSSPQEPGTFHRFQRLPPELRVIIWRHCLPHRVVELDEPFDESGLALPCGLELTSHMNGHPPLISRVCRESRVVALQSRSLIPKEGMPEDAKWRTDTQLNIPIDRSRDLVHLNWTPGSPYYHSRGSSVSYLAWHAAWVARGGSLMKDNLRYAEIDALKKMSSWLVVMRVVIIHARYEYAAKTGLFGLLGDAPVQVVEVSDEARVEAFFDFADESQRNGHVTHLQDLNRDSPEVVRRALDDALDRGFGIHKKQLPSMHPAIMFRLCTDMCNHSYTAEEGFRPSPEPSPPTRTRTLAHGQGRVYGRVRERVG